MARRDSELNGETYELSNGVLVDDPPVIAADGTVLAPGVKHYTMSYGTCVIPEGYSGCPLPITSIIEHPCNAKTYDPGAVGHDRVVRGAPAQIVGFGSVWMTTNEFSITVYGPGDTPEENEENAVKITEALYGANPDAAQFGKTAAFNARVRAHLCR